MYILAIETCIKSASVAIFYKNKIIDSFSDNNINRQAERLVIIIQEILERNLLNYKDITYLSLTKGPGSFTGTRVGISFAKALQLSQNIKIISFSVLEVIATKLINTSGNFNNYVIIHKGHGNEIYVQNFDRYINKKSELETINISDMNSYIIKLNGETAIAGSGLATLYNKLSTNNKNLFLFPRFPNPEARHMLKISYKKIEENLITKNIKPLYQNSYIN